MPSALTVREDGPRGRSTQAVCAVSLRPSQCPAAPAGFGTPSSLFTKLTLSCAERSREQVPDYDNTVEGWVNHYNIGCERGTDGRVLIKQVLVFRSDFCCSQPKAMAPKLTQRKLCYHTARSVGYHTVRARCAWRPGDPTELNANPSPAHPHTRVRSMIERTHVRQAGGGKTKAR